MNKPNINSRKSQGFTLLEALLGFLILSIGMLGIASLQALSLKAGKTSVYGSVAIMKVEELFESMRANPGNLVSYEGPGEDKGCTVGVICNAAELAAYDVFLWKANLKAGLPNATTTTAVVVTPPVGSSKMATVSVTVSWKESSTESKTGVNKTYATTTTICTASPC